MAGMEGHGVARSGKVWHGRQGEAWPVGDRLGKARFGRWGKSRQARQGMVGSGEVGHC